ncbi:hypothetical protein E4V16_09995, partial [Proteus mirabilis]
PTIDWNTLTRELPQTATVSENQHSLIYRWPLLNTFNSITK